MWAILDSGASSHFMVTDAPVIEKEKATAPLNIQLPDGASVTSSHTCLLDIPQLPRAVRIAHIVPGLHNRSLVSVVKLCNAGCEVRMNDISCVVKCRGKPDIQCRKCTKTGLWMIPLTPEGNTPQHSDHNAHNMGKQEFVATSVSRDFAANIITIPIDFSNIV